MLEKFFNDEKGMATMEVVIITAVLLTMAIVFKTEMLGFFKVLIQKVIGL